MFEHYIRSDIATQWRTTLGKCLGPSIPGPFKVGAYGCHELNELVAPPAEPRASIDSMMCVPSTDTPMRIRLTSGLPEEKRPRTCWSGASPCALVAGVGFEPTTFGL